VVKKLKTGAIIKRQCWK